MAHQLGVTRPLDDYFAIGLGVEAVSPLEMARAFATLANGGRRIDGSVLGNVPRAVLRVEDGGNADANDPVAKRAVEENDAAIVNSILQRVVSEGTGQRAALDDRPVAGKTGTTENYGDAWFVGYTPQLAVAVWVGYPDRLEPMETEFDGDPVAGGTFPALIWHAFAKRALGHLEEPPESFPYPSYDPVVARQVVFRNNKTLLDNGNCRGSRQILYFVGTGPESEATASRTRSTSPTSSARASPRRRPTSTRCRSSPTSSGGRRARRAARLRHRPEAEGGTLSSWSTVRIVLPRAGNGRVPDVVGLTVEQARRRLANRMLGVLETYVDGGRPGDRRRPVPARRARGDAQHDRAARHRPRLTRRRAESAAQGGAMEASVVPAPSGNTGPLGHPRGIGFGILLYIVTFGFYSCYWIYKTMEEIGRHVGEGLGGVLSLVIWILLTPSWPS